MNKYSIKNRIILGMLSTFSLATLALTGCNTPNATPNNANTPTNISTIRNTTINDEISRDNINREAKAQQLADQEDTKIIKELKKLPPKPKAEEKPAENNKEPEVNNNSSSDEKNEQKTETQQNTPSVPQQTQQQTQPKATTQPTTPANNTQQQQKNTTPQTTTPTQTTQPQTAPNSTMWDKIAQCESGGNWHINSGNNYFGGLQFLTSTWLAYGGGKYAPRADLATREQQIDIANNVYRSSGLSAWGCAGAAYR